jgi:hypothetical protein
MKASLTQSQLQEATTLWLKGWGTYAIAKKLGSVKLEAAVYNSVFYPGNKPQKSSARNVVPFPRKRGAA